MSVVPVPAQEQLIEALRHVVDPELHDNVVDLGMLQRVVVDEDGVATVDLALTIAGCPMRAELRRETESKLLAVPGVERVEVRMGEMTPDQRRALMDRARKVAAERSPDTEVPSTTRILAIASGKGGVGKSSVTVNLAVALARRGHTVGVLDADIWGFSVPRMLGVHGRLGGTDGKIEPNEQRVGDGVLKVVSMGHLVDDEGQALMWRGLILTKALEQFLTDVRWGELDYLLIDMPPGTGDVQMGLARLLPRAELIVVTTPATSAQKVAIRAADMARRGYLRVAGVVENMSAFTCAHGERHALFGEGGGRALADEIGAPLLGEVPLEPAVAAGADAGSPVALGDGPAADAFRAIADRIVAELPPLDAAGCTARMLSNIEDAVGRSPSPAA